MANPITLTTIAALAVAGAGMGVYFGKSAVSEINPIYYGSAGEERFHSDLVPYRSPTWAEPQTQTAAVVYSEGELGSGCVKCPIMDPGAAQAYDPAVGEWVEVREPQVEYAVYETATPAEPDPQVAEVERFAHPNGAVEIRVIDSGEATGATTEIASEEGNEPVGL